MKTTFMRILLLAGLVTATTAVHADTEIAEARPLTSGGVLGGETIRMEAFAGQPAAGRTAGATIEVIGGIRAGANRSGSCLSDVDGDGDVAFGDILRVLGAWGPCNDCPEDIDESGDVGFSDLLLILAEWGPCS